MGFDDDEQLYFLVAEHTKNACDGAFGHVKRNLRYQEAKTPQEMMNIIAESAVSTRCVPSVKVSWKAWKAFLGQFFTIPSTFKLSGPHVFKFHKDYTGKVKVKNFTDSNSESMFTLMKRNITMEHIRMCWNAEQRIPVYNAVIRDLEQVPSAHESNRKRYLTVNILDRYYRDQTELREKYFAAGAEGF